MIIEKLKQDKLQAMKDKNVVLRDLIGIVLTKRTQANQYF